MHPKILLVDDREDNLLSMESILEKDGYRFEKATSGKQVLKILLTQMDFALILMDVNMPNLNGFETASLIYERERLRHIPIIFITANQFGDENIFEGYKTGAVDYIYKPVKPDLLRAKVSVFVELYKKNSQLLAQEQKLIAINKSLELEIKERRASEETVTALNIQLVQNISRLETANKDLDLFAFMASHDLQAPLRKIRVFSDRLLTDYQDKIDEEGSAYLRRIQNGCKQMQLLIDDILEFSKITVKKELFQETDLNPIIDQILEEFQPSLQGKQIKVTLDKIPALCVNQALMTPLFSNLIGNAIKYSRNDIDPYIHIHSELHSSNNNLGGNAVKRNYCRIYVEDNGIGFEQKYAEEIFNMFRRLHPGAEYEGTGIGLALCKKIVEKHNGFISAKSALNEGSVFTLSLPVEHPLNA
jgi:light-regulated signal transduction histidine kinase (bacteriophytochrome)